MKKLVMSQDEYHNRPRWSNSNSNKDPNENPFRLFIIWAVIILVSIITVWCNNHA